VFTPEDHRSLRSNMDPVRPTANESSTTSTTAKKNGRGERRRRWEMSPADVRYFLPKAGTSLEHPELGREIPSENEALVESFRTSQPFYTLVAWKAVPEMEDGAPKIVKEALKRS